MPGRDGIRGVGRVRSRGKDGHTAFLAVALASMGIGRIRDEGRLGKAHLLGVMGDPGRSRKSGARRKQRSSARQSKDLGSQPLAEHLSGENTDAHDQDIANRRKILVHHHDPARGRRRPASCRQQRVVHDYQKRYPAQMIVKLCDLWICNFILCIIYSL